MAFVAARTDAGMRKQVNEDACCIEVAQTALGEVLMAIVCDGVGGLSRGNVASSTVIDRFARWFEGELPLLVEGMAKEESFDFSLVKAVWGTMLQTLNDLIRTHGIKAGGKLGTTFTGVIVCGGHYLVGHVGDCRAYRMNAIAFEQITDDQTLVAKKLAAGEITAEEAKHQPRNVILQSVGTERVVKPVFYEGPIRADDLFVICCDGAYHRAENEGIRHLFQHLDYRDEAALGNACDTLLRTDMDYGEKDNLTVVCFSGALAGAGEEPAAAVPHVAGATPVGTASEDDLPTMVESVAEEDDLPTMVDAGEPGDEDDLPTMVDSGEDEDDLPTMVESVADEDDLPTMVDSGVPEDEDDLPTMVESGEPEEEDDLPTMVESVAEEDDLPTMVDSGEPEEEDDLPTMVESVADEDDLPTMVDSGDDDDDLPTMVEGADA